LGVIEVFNEVYVNPVKDPKDADALLIEPAISSELLYTIGQLLPESFIITDRLITRFDIYPINHLISVLTEYIARSRIYPVELLQLPSWSQSVAIEIPAPIKKIMVEV
jgi:hypothetical protein